MGKKATTAFVTVEINYSDGSKDLVKSVELDASQMSKYNHPEAPAHINVGIEHPYRETWEDRMFYGRTVRDGLAYAYEGPGFFHLDVQLEATNKSGHLYSIQEIEPPMTRVFFRQSWAISAVGPKIVDATEEEVAELAEKFYSDYFYYLDVPS